MATERPIAVFGAGGLAREVEYLIHRINRVQPTWDFVGYVVSDPSKAGPYDSADLIVGDEQWLIDHDDVAVVIGIGTPVHRVRVGARLQEHLSDDRLPVLVDPSAVYDERSCTFEPGSVVTAGNVFTVNVRLERFAFVNLDCTIGHEATVGVGSVLNPSVNLSGGVNIGQGVLVGTGAQVLQYLSLGDGCTIGAGAVVTKDVPADALAVGVPARVRG